MTDTLTPEALAQIRAMLADSYDLTGLSEPAANTIRLLLGTARKLLATIDAAGVTLDPRPGVALEACGAVADWGSVCPSAPGHPGDHDWRRPAPDTACVECGGNPDAICHLTTAEWEARARPAPDTALDVEQESSFTPPLPHNVAWAGGYAAGRKALDVERVIAIASGDLPGGVTLYDEQIAALRAALAATEGAES